MKIRTRLAVLLSTGMMFGALGALTGGSAGYAATSGAEIANFGTGKCIAATSGFPTTYVVQRICDAENITGEKWIFNGPHGGIQQVYNLRSGLCLTATSLSNNAAVEAHSCGTADPGSLWAITDLGAAFPQRKITLRVYSANFCLDLPNGNATDLVLMQVYTCTANNNNQIFKVYA